MEFARPPRRPKPEAIVPMINVVFLLLIFFLMTAQITPTPPFQVTAPQINSDQDEPNPTAVAELFVARDGTLAFGTARDEAALVQIAETAAGAQIMLRADAGAEAAAIAHLLAQLAALGITDVTLATQPRTGAD
jgi:biopolymer transport protein ExbD